MDTDNATPRLTCVIADDHAAVRAATRAQLQRVGWIDVVSEAADGAAALDAIVAHEPDLAVLDVHMPARTGFEVCEAVTSRGLATQLILFTAVADPASVERAHAVGARCLLYKGDGFRVLREELEAVRAEA